MVHRVLRQPGYSEHCTRYEHGLQNTEYQVATLWTALILALEPLLVSLIIVMVNQDEHGWASLQDEWKKEVHMVTKKPAVSLWLGIVEDAEHETDRLGTIDGACPFGEILKKEAASRPSLRVGLEGEWLRVKMWMWM
jgi:hypothetical protein